jgi:aspartyl-tRNA(Asn)/glutamyl-tRNA(Gln) amidotransferase subunit A
VDCFSDIAAIQDGLAAGRFSAEELIRAYLDQCDTLEPQLNAFLALSGDAAITQARAVDAKRARGDALGPLAGVPIALKDNMVTDGQTTTAGSRILENWVPVYDGHVVQQVANADAVVVGKANMDEFAMGSSTENSAYGPSCNPWDSSRIPGGSSGGSAVAVAAGQACVSLGSDTGGSIRQPASLCGVLGLKPTWGRVSRYGLIAFASSLDQIGPFARNARDLAITLGVISGHDPRDSTSADRPVPDYTSDLKKGVEGLRIGIPKEYFGEGLDAEVGAAVHAAIAELERAGATTVEVSLPHTEHCLAAYYLIAPAEASSNLARFDGVRYGLRVAADDVNDMYKETRGRGFGREVTRRIMLGTYALSAGYYDAYYGKAQRVRTLIRGDFEAALTECDLLACPTSPVTAPALGEKVGDPLAMYLMDIYTISANLAGVPALSMPCGFSSDGLPIGLQLMGRWFDEERLLQAAAAYEQRSDWNARRPEVAGG